jgi:hypothetical protein
MNKYALSLRFGILNELPDKVFSTLNEADDPSVKPGKHSSGTLRHDVYVQH